jgi:beta-lactamase class A
MKKLVLVLVLLISGAHLGLAQSSAVVTDTRLQVVVDSAASAAMQHFEIAGLKSDEFAISVIDLTDDKRPVAADFRGESKIYPASVVKLFYVVAVERWLEDKRINDTPELRRAMRDMIVDSSNDATQYIVDVLTGTTSGYELSPAEMKEWGFKRNAVNRYFEGLGFRNINVNQKTFCEDSYGREHEFRGPNGENRNMLTTNATSRLLAEIATGRAVSAARSAEIMQLLKRDFSGASGGPDDQAHGFTSMALSPDTKLWSKAGWTSSTRHDAAYIEMPGGRRLVIVTFTVNHANEKEIIPFIARNVLAGLAVSK